jgi:hypothetical protein
LCRAHAGEFADSGTKKLQDSAREILRGVMKKLAESPLYKPASQLNKKAGAKLLKRMKKGRQELIDFEDEHALWGYVKSIFAKRAFNVCDSFLEIWHKDPRFAEALKGDQSPRVLSLGGGPGNCLVGFLVFERLMLARKKEKEGLAQLPRLFVCDYADQWGAIVDKVAETQTEPVQFYHCDMGVSVTDATNKDLQSLLDEPKQSGPSAQQTIVVYAFALHEVDHQYSHGENKETSLVEPSWAKLFFEVWDALSVSSVVLVKDQVWLERQVLRLVQQAGLQFVHRDTDVDGLFLLKTG